jgi:hypothetical protein
MRVYMQLLPFFVSLLILVYTRIATDDCVVVVVVVVVDDLLPVTGAGPRAECIVCR